jgi:hypothetical protein
MNDKMKSIEPAILKYNLFKDISRHVFEYHCLLLANEILFYIVRAILFI